SQAKWDLRGLGAGCRFSVGEAVDQTGQNKDLPANYPSQDQEADQTPRIARPAVRQTHSPSHRLNLHHPKEQEKAIFVKKQRRPEESCPDPCPGSLDSFAGRPAAMPTQH